MVRSPIIVWFRQDLRLTDHRALLAAAEQGPIVAVYILDDETPQPWGMGAASRWWLHHSLAALSEGLEASDCKLVLRRGRFDEVLCALAKEVGAEAVYCSRSYEPWAVALEVQLKAALDAQNVQFKRYAGTLLREPETLQTKANEPYKVFTPFWNALSRGEPPAKPQGTPKTITTVGRSPRSDRLSDWALLPTKPDWASGFRATWQPGEVGAEKSLEAFLDETIDGYARSRDLPGKVGTSRLSPHLHFGEISPSRVWHAVMRSLAGRGSNTGAETYLKEVVWREFCHHLLFHFPSFPEKPFRPEFAKYPWSRSQARLRAWQRGQTGYPIVDAGMRELWHTGFMHNRVRMITASFLIKHLLINWTEGQAWFWDTLVDADLANNAANWQWVAGSGADASPYFRIFNPMTQGAKFDADGRYVRQWVPELAELPDAHLHAPWEAPALVLAAAGVTLGQTYPSPIVDHAQARADALAGYAKVKSAAG